MDIVNIVIMLLIGVFGGFISGLVGVGGAIIIFPAILLLPPLFGAPAYSAYIASGLTSSQVFFSTLSGSLKARKKTEFSPQLVLYMGGGMIIGSMLGAFLANLFDAIFVNTVYIIIALLALTLMFIKVKPSSEKSSFNSYHWPFHWYHFRYSRCRWCLHYYSYIISFIQITNEYCSR